MICDGKCKIEKETEEGVVTKKCGLFRTVIFQNNLDGKTQEFEMCVFDAIMNSLHRQEQGQIRVQAAVESSRNENADGMAKAHDIIARGFLGLIKEAEFHRITGNESHTFKLED
jgi:hypothetical protein